MTLTDKSGKGHVVKAMLRAGASETDKAITVDLPEVREMGGKIGEDLGHIGNLYVDIMQRVDGAYCVLELNPRFGGGFPFSYEAGVNFPKALIQMIKGESFDPQMLVPEYRRMFSKNDYLMEIK